MPGATTSPISSDPRASAAPEQELYPALALVWSKHEPHRVGEVALFPWLDRPLALGVGSGEGEDRAELVRQRPGSEEKTGPIESEGVSRQQLVAERVAHGLCLLRAGRCPTFVNGEPLVLGRVAVPGDIIEWKRRALFLVTQRPRMMRRHAWPDGADAPFGEPDVGGMIGESLAKWTLSDRIAFVARQEAPALVRGESGSGKELVANTLHVLSRRTGNFIRCNAAAFTVLLLAAELFGNVKNFPNPGMADRPGLVGLAHKGTLFLDEFAQLPRAGQDVLLRLLDQKLEYQRGGEGTTRYADLRFVGAMNRALHVLKDDVLERFHHRVEVPSLNERREDIPIVARHMVLRAAVKDKDAERFVRKVRGRMEVSFDQELMAYLVGADWTNGNVRRLVRALEVARAEPGNTLRLVPAVRREVEGGAKGRGDAREEREDRDGTDEPLDGPSTRRAVPDAKRPKPTADEVRAALSKEGWSKTRAAKRLGLSDRNALRRLMVKYGIKDEGDG